MKNISILGCSGSIGSQSVKIIQNHSDKFCVKALVCYSNIDVLREQIKSLKPEFCGIVDKDAFDKFDKLEFPKVQFEYGEKSLVLAASMQSVDTVLVSVNGICGLLATLEAIKNKKQIALASKEVLVGAGSLVMQTAKQYGVTIFPVDSEHSAVFQAMQAGKKKDIKRLILTASGGAFRDYSIKQMQSITVADALKHPNWNMGKKITIDCATMMNKGLECIEAKHLFSVRPNQIECIIHRESIIHSMVEYVDNSVLAQMSYPSMEIPIQLAFSYPNRYQTELKSLDFASLRSLSFEKINVEKYPCFTLAMQVLKEDNHSALVLNCANEILVNRAIRGEIALNKIASGICFALEKIDYNKSNDLSNILEIAEKTNQLSKTYQ